MNQTKLPLPFKASNPPARKVSLVNLDSLYSALLSLLNLHADRGSAELIAALTMFHNSISTRVDMDVLALIKLLKVSQLWFVAFLRNDHQPRGAIALSDWDISYRCPGILVPFVRWHDKWAKDLTSKSDLYARYLQVIYAALSAHRVIVVPAPMDFSTITEGPPSWVSDLFRDNRRLSGPYTDPSSSSSPAAPVTPTPPVSSPVAESVSDSDATSPVVFIENDEVVPTSETIVETPAVVPEDVKVVKPNLPTHKTKVPSGPLYSRRGLPNIYGPYYNGVIDGKTRKYTIVPAHSSYFDLTKSALKDLIRDALSRMGINTINFMEVYAAKCSNFSFSIVTTAGPNGQATWSAYEDAVAVRRSPILRDSLIRFANRSGLEAIVDCMIDTAKAPSSLSTLRGGRPVTGRIHPIEEWGGKMRLVAIIDYWTQSVLSPLHDTIAHFLSTLPNDGTFNQDSIIGQVSGWVSDPDKQVFSYDLTAATDRIPINFQRLILEVLLDSVDLARDWANIMSKRRFACPDGIFRRYMTGQPMGAKSSFAMLALTHHVIMQMCAANANIAGHFKDYVVLGDDNTMCDTKVSDRYVHLMDKLGVPINLSKSYVPVVDCKSVGEICKRTFLGSIELSALPVKLIVKCTKFGHMAPDLQSTLVKRGMPILANNLFTWFAGLIDKRSLSALLVLNTVPLDVSGFTKRFRPNLGNLDPAAWYDGYKLTESDISQAFLYALITEQLKRVDALLRATIAMSEVIEGSTGSPSLFSAPVGMYSPLTDAQRDRLAKRLPAMRPTHPVFNAARSELDRVISLLARLRSDSSEMTTMARAGLLDLLRNSLAEIWDEPSESGSTVRRSIFNSMLSCLEQATSAKNKGKVSFSLLLTSVERMWTVQWAIGSSVVINVVKSRVGVSTVENAATLSKVGAGIQMKGLRL